MQFNKEFSETKGSKAERESDSPLKKFNTQPVIKEEDTNAKADLQSSPLNSDLELEQAKNLLKQHQKKKQADLKDSKGD